MARAQLPIGTWGAISTWVVQTDGKGKAVKHKSQARFRDHDGRLRPVSAYGKTKTEAERSSSRTAPGRATPASSLPCTRSPTSSTFGSEGSKDWSPTGHAHRPPWTPIGAPSGVATAATRTTRLPLP